MASMRPSERLGSGRSTATPPADAQEPADVGGRLGETQTFNLGDLYDRRIGQLKLEMIEEQQTSLPCYQLNMEMRNTMDLVLRLNQSRDMIVSARNFADFEKLVSDLSTGHWKVQRIWNEDWLLQSHDGMSAWKHESTSETGAEPGLQERAGMQQDTATCGDDASRPFYQFLHQVVDEFKFIETGATGPIDTSHIDIGSAAYEKVRNRWAKKGMWNWRWGALPGKTWKHEQPVEELMSQEFGDDGQTYPMREPSSPSASQSNDEQPGHHSVPQQGTPINADPQTFGSHSNEPVGTSAASYTHQEPAFTGPSHMAESGTLNTPWQEPPLAKESYFPSPSATSTLHEHLALSGGVPLSPPRHLRRRAVRVAFNQRSKEKDSQAERPVLAPIDPMRVSKPGEGFQPRHALASIPVQRILQEARQRMAANSFDPAPTDGAAPPVSNAFGGFNTPLWRE